MIPSLGEDELVIFSHFERKNTFCFGERCFFLVKYQTNNTPQSMTKANNTIIHILNKTK